MNEKPKTKPGWRWLRRTLIGTAVLATLIAVFYTEEDWRGKRAWENYKCELEAKGEVLDWNKFIPPPVPDDQNFFTASTNILLRFVKQADPVRADAAANLRWLRLINYFTNESNSFPILDFSKSPSPVVAELMVVSSGVAKNDSIIQLNESTALAQIQNLLRTTIGRSASGSQGFQFSELQMSNLSPAKIYLQADTPISPSSLKELIPSDLVTNIGRLVVTATVDPKIFQVKFVSGQITAAADYLKWSDQFESAFDEIREALKRPYAIIPGDYSQPYWIPIPNFVTLRAVAQTLAQRAQCDFLLNQPDKALRELTLMRDVCRILQKPPTGQPMTLVEAMISVAISGVYASTVADGFRLHAWQEPQLAALQKQLGEINLFPDVDSAFKMERVASTYSLEKTSPAKIAELFKMVGAASSESLWKKITDPMYLFFKLSPRGWIYQNMTAHSRLMQLTIESLPLENQIVMPKQVDEANNRVVRTIEKNRSPFYVWSRIAIPNFSKAIQVSAFNQTLVNEAQIVCALESYKLAHGNYPETLDVLVPQFTEKIPYDIIGGQSLHYHRTDDGKFMLYSVGWNETDDGGQVSEDRAKGDWVWKN